MKAIKRIKETWKSGKWGKAKVIGGIVAGLGTIGGIAYLTKRVITGKATSEELETATEAVSETVSEVVEETINN